jgi:hypothetical protein
MAAAAAAAQGVGASAAMGNKATWDKNQVYPEQTGQEWVYDQVKMIWRLQQSADPDAYSKIRIG